MRAPNIYVLSYDAAWYSTAVLERTQRHIIVKLPMRTLFSDFTEVGRSDLLSVCIVVVLTSPVSPYIIMSWDDHTEIFPRLFGVNI